MQHGREKVSSLFVISIVLCLCTFNVLPYQVFSQNATQPQTDEHISAEDMQTYAQTLINTYIQEVYQYFPNTTAYWTFWPNTFYNATFYISSTKGAAILIEPSNISGSYSHTINTTEPIEIAVFGGDPSLEAWIPQVGGDTMFSFISENIGNSPFINLTSDYSSMIIQGVLLTRTNSQLYYYYVDIKASNSINFWTTDVAKAEANEVVYSDAGKDFFNSQDFILLVGIPELTSLLENIRSNFSNPNYSLTQYEADLRTVNETAEKLGVNSTLLNELIEFLNAQITGILPTFPQPTSPSTSTTLPKKTIFNQVVNDPQNILYVSCLGFGAVLDLLLLVCLDSYRKTKKPVVYKIIFGAPPAFLSAIFLPDLLYYRPYDLDISQIIAIALIWIVGASLIVKGRKKLVLPFKGKRTRSKGSR